MQKDSYSNKNKVLFSTFDNDSESNTIVLMPVKSQTASIKLDINDSGRSNIYD